MHVLLSGAMLCAVLVAAHAQRPTRPPRQYVGFVRIPFSKSCQSIELCFPSRQSPAPIMRTASELSNGHHLSAAVVATTHVLSMPFIARARRLARAIRSVLALAAPKLAAPTGTPSANVRRKAVCARG